MAYYDAAAQAQRQHQPAYNQPAPAYGQHQQPPSYDRPQYDTSYSSSSTHLQRPGQGPSPFDTVFDDPAYSRPADPYDKNYQNTGGYGYGGPSSPGGPMQDGIQMHDRPGHPDAGNDHIYDANGMPPPVQGAKDNTKIQSGELGMIGSSKKRIPWVVYFFSVVQAAVFIGEIIKNGILTGSPIMIKPQFNPMIGPSPQVLINMGARYTLCMHNDRSVQGQTIPVQFLCPNATSNDNFCPLSTVCGFGGVPDPKFNGDFYQDPAPNQWFRFITPIFMHAGLIHIGFNLLLQLTLAKEMEMAIGSIRFFIVYMSAGIFGFVMGGNFAAPAIASTGASGSLFGIIALTLLDLLYSWKDRRNPVKELMFIILDVVIAFVLGLLPGLDNFSHIGGFLMGLALGICVLHSPNALRKRLGDGASYSAVNGRSGAISPPFLKNPVGFFQNRKPLWWGWWLVRAGVLVGIIVVFIVLLNNFYHAQTKCEWCKYLSCLVSQYIPQRSCNAYTNLSDSPSWIGVSRELLEQRPLLLRHQLACLASNNNLDLKESVAVTTRGASASRTVCKASAFWEIFFR